MKVYEGLAQAFVDEGTTAVFGMMGTANQHWLNAISKLGVKIYDVRHEGTGLAMAEAMAITNGSPGICTTTSGPAVTQLATTMVVASRSKTPLVVFCGDERWGDIDHNHAFNPEPFAAAIECGFLRVTSAETAYETIQRAFYVARTESRPMMVSAPLDVQLSVMDDMDEYIPSSALIAPKTNAPDPSAILEAADIIAGSKFPVLILGHGAVVSEAGNVALRVADRIGGLVATTMLAMNWPISGRDYHVGMSGLYSTKTAMELFQDADCVIAVGASLNKYTTEHGYLYPNARFVQINVKPQVAMGDGRLADCYVQGDGRLALEMIDEILANRSIQQIGYRTPGVLERLAAAHHDPVVYELEDGTVDPRDACIMLDEMLPHDVGLVISGSHGPSIALMLCQATRTFIHVNKYFGGMSKGLAAGIGATIATSAPTAVVEGDAGFMMHLSEFETAVRYNLPLLVAVLNDQALGAEYHDRAVVDGELDASLTLISTPDLGAVGVALGGRGHLVQSLEDLRVAISDFVSNPGPMLVDIRTSRNVISVPYRRILGIDDV
jgi:thiamine pyrophosphate-dependent acetolactate synthase large subunit-like protein